MAQPRRRVVLALDGPAPLAKLLEQRCVGAGCVASRAGLVPGWPAGQVGACLTLLRLVPLLPAAATS